MKVTSANLKPINPGDKLFDRLTRTSMPTLKELQEDHVHGETLDEQIQEAKEQRGWRI